MAHTPGIWLGSCIGVCGVWVCLCAYAHRCMYVHVETKGWCLTRLSPLLFTLFWGTGSLRKPGVTDLTDWSASPRLHHSHRPPARLFMRVLGIWTQVLKLVSTLPTSLPVFPEPHKLFCHRAFVALILLIYPKQSCKELSSVFFLHVYICAKGHNPSIPFFPVPINSRAHPWSLLTPWRPLGTRAWADRESCFYH